MVRRLLGLTVVLSAAYALLGAVQAFAAPVGMVCTNGTGGPGVANFSLQAKKGTIETPDGNTVFVWSYADQATGATFQLPGPALCVNQGDTVTVTLTNPAGTGIPEPVSIVFPGQDNVTANGAGLTQPVFSGGALTSFAETAAPGGSVSYSFVASQPGTYLYESGTDPAKQVEMGLYGALVVRPRTTDVPGGVTGHAYAYDAARSEYDPTREYLLIFHELDPVLHHSVETGGAYDFTAFHPRYFTVSGRAFPDTIQNNGVPWLPAQPYGTLVRVKPFDATRNALPALVRIVNAGLLNHPFHPHGFHVQEIAQDGRLFQTPGGADASTEHFGDVVPAGASQDLLFTYTDLDKLCTAGTATSPGTCTSAGYSTANPLPSTLVIPSYRNMTFKDNVTWFSGSPYIGVKGTLPTGVVSYNNCGEYYFPWHSHALNEFVNYDEGFGGLATLLRVDPLPGCTAFASTTTIIARPTGPATAKGTAGGGSFLNLGTTDASYYVVNSTGPTTGAPPYDAHWYAGFTGVAQGGLNLKVSYTGKCSVACNQTIYVWKWTTPSGWVQIDPAPPATSRAVGTTDVPIADIAVPPSPAAGKWSSYIGTGANAGQVRVRVSTSRAAGTGVYSTSGNFMKLTYDAP